MQQYLTRENYRKLEAWALTIFFGVFIFQLLVSSRGENRYTPYRFQEHHIKFNYIENVFLPFLIQGIALYAVFMVLILVVERKWEEERSVLQTGISLFFLGLFTALVVAITDTYSDAWRFGIYGDEKTAYNHIFFDAFVLVGACSLLYISYYLLKQLIGQLVSKMDWSLPSTKTSPVKAGAGLAVWFLVFIFMVITNAPTVMIATWLIMIPYSALFILLNIWWLIPTSEVRSFFHSSYIWRMLMIFVLLDLIASLIFGAAGNLRGEHIAIIFLLVMCWTAVALLPWAWYIYKNSQDKTKLVNALGKSDASLSFLKSQINPHFLFNALNTLYGTALQENADRTGEGIQKLGDMMRFMLQENVQDKIALARDVDYLNNYIALQKLRTSRSADIVIETQIEEQLNNLEITPMLLIPFVENAFKHGISLKEPSHIKITLQTRETKLYFDVHNSIHIKAENDPERLKSGIGLQNVKQRLAMLYPGKHELIIRESAKEFFIHLTLELR